MKFYDLEWLAKKCGTDNKYEITAKIAAEARRESEAAFPERNQEKNNDNSSNELFISKVLAEIEEDKSPISVNYIPPAVTPEPELNIESPEAPKAEPETYSATPDDEAEDTAGE